MQMPIDLQGYALMGIVNPNTRCTQLNFISQTNPEIPQKALIIFDEQIKYIEVEAHPTFRRVRVYIRGTEGPIDIDFFAEQSELYDLFLKSLYNK